MKAKWHGAPFRDYSNGKWLLTFETSEVPEVYDKTKDKELNMELKEYRRRRSLNANAYFHVLVDKLAEVRGLSHAEMHNILICRYGYVDDEIKNIIMDDSIPWEQLDSIHLRPTKHTRVLDNGKLYRVYEVMRGSHTYDTKEMSRLIDGTVSDAKEQGIETLSPDELERMKQQWHIKV
jgi:hypothetical protein